MNGYIAIEINSEKIGLKFGMPANRLFTEKMGQNLDLVTSEGTINEIGVAYLIYFGYLNNCLVKDVEQAHSFGYFMEWVEDNMFNEDCKKVFQDIANCYKDSRYTKEWLKRMDETTEEVKKKIAIGI